MRLAHITLAAVIGLANIAALPYAIEQSDNADRAHIATVKADNQERMSDSYYESEQYKAAQHANNFLRQVYKDKAK